MSEEANEAIEMQRELEKKIKLRTQKEKQAIQNIKSAINGMDDDATFDVDLVNSETAKFEHKTIKVGDLRLILVLQERQYEENGSLKLSGRNLITEMDELEEELSDYKKGYEKLEKENEELKVCYRQSKVETENLREKRDKYYLLISKIRAKLSHYEGLKKSEFQKHFEETGLPGNNFVDAVLAISRINLLKELLEEE